ncbi:MAG: hypothetical protein JNL24_14160 [Bacteroidia bacterium]|nr:hypothetical protein [Bacteroidia bacterium]
MAFYSYKITRDYGFAPNPFFGFCTLACCKPHIRAKAEVGDWIIGTGSIENHLLYNLIFVMKVSEKISFEDYWNDKRFVRKKPIMNGSLKQIHGDNIYYIENDHWCQMDSHHSFYDGGLNEANLKQDLSGKFVLISDCFIYLGNNHMKVPEKYLSLCPNSKQRNYITIKDNELAEEFVEMITNKYQYGVQGEPLNWIEYNQRSLF